MPGIFGETDACPSCHKTCKNMATEHAGKVLHIYEALIICTRCGTVFVPQSRIKYLFTAAESKIVDPNTEKSLIVKP